MASQDGQLQKLARRQRHAERHLGKGLKARFSPTAVFGPDTGTDQPTATPPDPDPKTSATATGTTATTAKTPSTPAIKPTTSSTTVTSSTSKIPTTTSTSSTPTSTSSTTPSTTSTTSTKPTTSSTPTPTPTPTTTAVSTPTTSLQPTSSRVTTTLSSSVVPTPTSSVASAASATPSTTASSGMSTAGIIGIAAAGIVGAAVVAGIVMFFCRRRNRRDEDFDPADFKRQSETLQDDPPVSLLRGLATHEAHAYPSSPSFVPGQYIPSRSPAPPGAQYANAAPFFNPSFQSPMGSPVTVASYGGAQFDAHCRLMRTPSNATAPMVSRGNSFAQPQHPGSLQPAEESDYADLSRASVTPFQAAQYAEISKQLNIAPPTPLHQVSEVNEAEEYEHVDRQRKPSMESSPFDDPRAGSTRSSGNVDDAMKFNPSRPSSEFHPANSFAHPADPSPRVASVPPTLPEFEPTERAFSPIFPVAPSPRKPSFDMPNPYAAEDVAAEHSSIGRVSPKVDLPPLSPVLSTPQRAQFMNGLESDAHNGRETPVEIGFVAESPKLSQAPSPAPAPAPAASVAPAKDQGQAPGHKRPDTMYDDEDAYGGF
ncbi:hypothetical protein DFH11DRAFT_1800800 [Phellopilus nigrolimitatus]|nr:hypothetical protein DFH11DRAFT_1800800 [Phellopilus nigrolimitatus]